MLLTHAFHRRVNFDVYSISSIASVQPEQLESTPAPRRGDGGIFQTTHGLVYR